MTFVVAHLGHWYESALFAVPMLVIGAVLWRSSKKERLAGNHADDDWDGEEEWRDPRLDDDSDDRF
ncbi:MAG: hypothetical protein J7513_03035 [Solirubrobacteraceae bacterium]|nr:hypothetical protein [Solirubrobacteraceae bacterium]